MAKLIGNDVGIFIDDVLIACAKSCSISGTSTDIDVSCKGTGDWGDTKTGKLGWSASSNNIIDYSATYGWSQLFNAWRSKATPTLKYALVNEVIGDKHYTGTVSVASWDRSDDQDSASEYTVNFTGKGALSEVTV